MAKEDFSLLTDDELWQEISKEMEKEKMPKETERKTLLLKEAEKRHLVRTIKFPKNSGVVRY